MSAQCMGWVLRHSKQKGSALLVLIAIADHADPDGKNAWPSVKTLAKFSRLTERAVQYILRKLEEQGDIVCRQGAGPYGSNAYEVIMAGDANFSVGVQSLQGGENFAGVQNSAPGGETAIAPNPPGNPSENHLSSLPPQPPRKRKSAEKAALGAPVPLAVPPELETFHRTLSEDPGYRPTAGFLESARKYAGVLDLQEEAVLLMGWLDKPNPKAPFRGRTPRECGRTCNTLYVLTWLRRALADQQNQQAEPATMEKDDASDARARTRTDRANGTAHRGNGETHQRPEGGGRRREWTERICPELAGSADGRPVSGVWW